MTVQSPWKQKALSSEFEYTLRKQEECDSPSSAVSAWLLKEHNNKHKPRKANWFLRDVRTVECQEALGHVSMSEEQKSLNFCECSINVSPPPSSSMLVSVDVFPFMSDGLNGSIINVAVSRSKETKGAKGSSFFQAQKETLNKLTIPSVKHSTFWILIRLEKRSVSHFMIAQRCSWWNDKDKRLSH